MNLTNLWEKLPRSIQESEKIYLFTLKTIHRIQKEDSHTIPPNKILTSDDMAAKGTLKDIQLIYLELLRFIDNVCEKHDLEYFLTYGTLLGAIRHEGFIPWDDDCDIIMMREDYNKLIEILPEEINNYEWFKENCTLTKLVNKDKNIFSGFNSTYEKELGHEEFFNSPGLGKSLFLQIGWLKPMVKLDIFPYDYIKPESIDNYNKNYLNYKLYFRNLFNCNFPYLKKFDELSKKLGLVSPPESTEFIAEGIDGSFSDSFPPYKKELFFPPTYKDFEEYKFKCPNKSEELLNIWYGNYMEIPKEVVIHEYVKFNETLFESETEMNKSFKEVITYLKNINDNFK